MNTFCSICQEMQPDCTANDEGELVCSTCLDHAVYLARVAARRERERFEQWLADTDEAYFERVGSRMFIRLTAKDCCEK